MGVRLVCREEVIDRAIKCLEDAIDEMYSSENITVTTGESGDVVRFDDPRQPGGWVEVTIRRGTP